MWVPKRLQYSLYALLNLMESWKKFRDKNGYAAAVLMDLSIAFDTINHELLVAKLHEYGVTGPSLRLLMSYLSNRHQGTKVNEMYSMGGTSHWSTSKLCMKASSLQYLS